MSLTSVIIQARMGSTRFPGKILKQINGKSILYYVITQCLRINNIENVCCVIPEGLDSDPIADEAKKCDAIVVRGPEHDVLARYYKAAFEIGSENIIRVTSDCPLIDPLICSKILELHFKEKLDYTCNNMPPSFPHGLDCEVFTRDALNKAFYNAHSKNDREHVTPWLRRDIEISKASVKGPGGEIVNMRWTLDYLEDYLFFKALFKYFPIPSVIPSYTDILNILDTHPEIININAEHVEIRQ